MVPLTSQSDMRVAVFVALSSLLGCSHPAPPTRAAPFENTVFQSGADDYAYFRIPTIVKTRAATLLAFGEGRVDDAADFGNIDIVLRRSTDGGRTWGALQVVVDFGGEAAGNPTPVVDGQSGRIHLAFMRSPPDATVDSIRGGEDANARTGWITHSDDDGLTWSTPRDITDQVTRPDWPWLNFGPVHAIQLTRGPYAGRLVFPANHSTPEGADYRWLGAHLVYSDDGGETFHIGGVEHPKNNVVNPNESTVVELADGRLLINTRDMRGTAPGNRAETHSSDGGESFDGPFRGTDAITISIVQASLLRFSARDAGDTTDRLLFSGPSDPQERANLSIRSSFDEGRTWQEGAILHEGFAAYSDMVVLDEGAVGVVYEAGTDTNYAFIGFQRVNP